MINEAMAVTDAKLLNTVDGGFRDNGESTTDRFCGSIGQGSVT